MLDTSVGSWQNSMPVPVETPMHDHMVDVQAIR